ncbi:MAG: bifunctional folylpolyglutamate synthase/dihydrofolate synthase [Dehalococcoidia bacterium]|nr:bifunctional folylpolyglutamate synthase/dihydrofolate synthase [Dehalococcoidia bacterium]
MDYEAAIQYLQSFSDFERTGSFTARPDLRPMLSLLARLEDPQRGRLTVHVAGSKGKGSVCAMVESILRKAGFRTGLFTSPHLHSYRERVRVGGRPIAEETLARLTATLVPAVRAQMEADPARRFVTFDLLTALGFLAFREMEVQAQIMEVGLGGRLDSTNVFEETDVCVVTPVSLEHTEVLGETAEEIAREKAAIARAGSALVMGPQPFPEAAVEIRRAADSAGAALVDVAADVGWERLATDVDGQSFRINIRGAAYRLWLPLLGEHQVENAATAVACVDSLRQRGLPIADEAIEQGLSTIRWPGRLEVLARSPLMIADSAHNRDSAKRLRLALSEIEPQGPLWLVVGSSSGKDLGGLAEQLAPLAEGAVATRSGHPRAMPPADVAAAFRREGMPVHIEDTVAAALDRAVECSAPDSLICITGSIFLAAEARGRLLGIADAAMWGES